MKLTDLTPRRRQVAELVAARLTYPQIADRLGCKVATVQSHVMAIAAKLPEDRLPARRRIEEWVRHAA